ncbi:MAG: CRISPR-associated CARF protein Csa3 [Desulfurococcaceae archaeon]
MSCHGKTLVATFGFDIDFVLRRLASREYGSVVLLALKTSEEAYRKVEKAYSTLKIVCESLRISCSLNDLEPEVIARSIPSILKNIAEKSERVELFLTGGPRILVVTTLLSALLLPKYLAEKINIIVEGEGFECENTINLSKYQELARLDERDMRILLELQARGPQRLGELEKHTEIPRSTLFRRLEELTAKKLVRKENDKYLAEEVIKTVCADISVANISLQINLST